MGGSRKGVHVDIERIFTVKVQVFGSVDFTLESILLNLLKIAFKALIELVRQSNLNRRGYTQLQVDVQLVRQAISAFVRDGSVLENLLEEVSLLACTLVKLIGLGRCPNSSRLCCVCCQALISAGERSVEPIQGVDPSAISSVVSSEHARLVSARR